MSTAEDAGADSVSAEDTATIMETVMGEAAHADDDVNTAEELVYRVNNFELEVERCAQPSPPPWSQPRGNSMVSLVNSHTNATRIGWHLWEIDIRFAPGLPPGWY